MVVADGIIEYDLDSRPVREAGVPQYSERVIHGEIYKARPDVMSVCHHHSPSFLPLLTTGTDYVSLNHIGVVGGIKPPWWDQHDEFGDTNMLVVKPEEGASLARALASHQMVLMRRHGVTIVGGSVRDCVYRAIQTCRNAECLVRALSIGPVSPLSPGEFRMASEITGTTTGVTRSWNSWVSKIIKSGDFRMAKSKNASRAKPKRRARSRRR